MKKNKKLTLGKITIAGINNGHMIKGGDPFPTAACDTLLECTNGCPSPTNGCPPNTNGCNNSNACSNPNGTTCNTATTTANLSEFCGIG